MLHSLTLPASTFLAAGGEEAMGGAMMLVWLAFMVVVIAGMWKTFTKAGKPGWAAIIPIYNIWVLIEIAGRPGWWLLLILFIPVVNLIMLIIVYIDVAQAFGKGAGFAIGLVFLGFIFFPILGFGSATYKGPPARAA